MNICSKVSAKGNSINKDTASFDSMHCGLEHFTKSLLGKSSHLCTQTVQYSHYFPLITLGSHVPSSQAR